MLNKKVFLVIFLIFEVATSAKSFLNDDMKEKLYDQVISTTKWVMRVKEEVPIEEDVKFYLYTKYALKAMCYHVDNLISL